MIGNQKIEPANAFLIVDTIAKILDNSNDMLKLSKWLASEIREITGARLVIIVSKNIEDNDFNLLEINPKRKSEFIEKKEISNLIKQSLLFNKIAELDFDNLDNSIENFLKKLGFELNLIIPLVANSEILGSLLVLGLPNNNDIELIKDTYRNLSVLLGLVFRNANLINNQEKIIIERTKELVEKQKILYESEEKLRGYIDFAPHGVFVVDEKGNYMDVNPEACNITGYSKDELLSMNILDLNSKDDLNSPIRRFKKVVDEGFASTESSFIKKDGTLGYWTIDAVKLNEKRILGFVIDITERKQVELNLRESEEKFRALFNNSEVGMFISRLDGSEIFEFNQKYLDILGYTQEEIRGTPSMNLWANEYEREKMVESLKADGYVKDLECDLINKKGEVIRCIASVKLYREEGILEGSILDITDRKRAEELLKEQNQELEIQYEEYMQLNEILRLTNFDLEISKAKAEESDKLKTAFLQNMSHEIRTPLNGIIGFSTLLQDEDISKDEIKEFTNLIKNSGSRLIEIVNNVLDISKIETGQIEIKKKTFSVNLLMSNLYSFFMPTVNAKGLKFNYHTFQDDITTIINSDESKLNQILTNLLFNAIKFTNVGSIDFGYEIYENNLLFYVKDTGIGIPKDFHERIFERFMQAELSISRSYEGAGLGLAICKGLVELLGGRMWLESELKKGSTFFFTLPYFPNSLINEITKETNKNYTFLKVSKILIAEDDYVSFRYLKRLLKRDDIIILYAENGEQAVNFVRNTPDIDLILMDIRMPVMDGMEATRQIKRLKPDLPVIAQTAYAFNTERDMILSIGCDDYISKPVEPELLLNLIKKYIH
jgi:PAS domain S-box-containing protein